MAQYDYDGYWIANDYWGTTFQTTRESIFGAGAIVASTWNGTTLTDTFWVNGTGAGTWSVGQTLITDGEEMAIGSYVNGGPGTAPFGGGGVGVFGGDIAEVILYNRLLNADELNSVGYYLASKYSISPTDYTAPSTTTSTTTTTTSTTTTSTTTTTTSGSTTTTTTSTTTTTTTVCSTNPGSLGKLLTLTDYTAGAEIQWQKSPNGVDGWAGIGVPVVDGNTLDVSSHYADNPYFRAVVTDACAANSPIVKVTTMGSGVTVIEFR